MRNHLGPPPQAKKNVGPLGEIAPDRTRSRHIAGYSHIGPYRTPDMPKQFVQMRGAPSRRAPTQ
eukprot:848980-Prymnesium_polylepis.1